MRVMFLLLLLLLLFFCSGWEINVTVFYLLYIHLFIHALMNVQMNIYFTPSLCQALLFVIKAQTS